jgi:hypothetical protein
MNLTSPPNEVKTLRSWWRDCPSRCPIWPHHRMSMFVPMDSMFLWTMRKRKKMRRSEDFLVYNDWLCTEFNNFKKYFKYLLPFSGTTKEKKEKKRKKK